VVELLVNQ
jgi:hypothetical protein